MLCKFSNYPCLPICLEDRHLPAHRSLGGWKSRNDDSVDPTISVVLQLLIHQANAQFTWSSVCARVRNHRKG